ncbi:MAG: ThiF family adenylyltransferase [Promethearchaeota archaeon]
MLLKNQKISQWSDQYYNQIERNIGYITFSEQEQLRVTPIAILGVGGLGGPLAEQLVRSGCENLVICDWDVFEESNLNRQICSANDIGCYKVDVLEKYLININPQLKIKKYYNVLKTNISDLIKDCIVVALALDDPLTSIIISRECQVQNIPMIESWVIPCLWAWWFTKYSISYEDCYGLNTQDLSIEQIEQSKLADLKSSDILFPKILEFPGVKEIYNRENGVYEATISGEIGIRTIAPFVRLTASYLALEIIFAGVLKTKPMILAPLVIGYDYFRMKPVQFTMI